MKTYKVYAERSSNNIAGDVALVLTMQASNKNFAIFIASNALNNQRIYKAGSFFAIKEK